MEISENLDEVYNYLLTIGNLYNFEINDDDYYNLEKNHNILKYVYDGVYPMHKILANVRKTYKIMIPTLNFTT